MANEKIRIGVANEGELDIDLETIKTWEPKNITYIGDTVFFKNGGAYFSMKTINFNNIFKK